MDCLHSLLPCKLVLLPGNARPNKDRHHFLHQAVQSNATTTTTTMFNLRVSNECVMKKS